MITMTIQITRVHRRLKKSISRIIQKNIRNSISLLILFGIGHILTFLNINGLGDYIKHLFEVATLCVE